MKPATLKKYKLVIDQWFINGFNGAKAYGKIYPRTKGTSSAPSEFLRLLTHPEVQEYRDYKYKQVQKLTETSHLEILDYLKSWAYSDITETIDLTTEEIKALPIEIRRLITGYKVVEKEYGNVKEKTITLTFVGKEKALEMINKHVGFYSEDNKQKESSITNIINLGDGKEPKVNIYEVTK